MGMLAAGVALLFMQMHHAVHRVVHHMRLNVRALLPRTSLVLCFDCMRRRCWCPPCSASGRLPNPGAMHATLAMGWHAVCLEPVCPASHLIGRKERGCLPRLAHTTALPLQVPCACARAEAGGGMLHARRAAEWAPGDRAATGAVGGSGGHHDGRPMRWPVWKRGLGLDPMWRTRLACTF